jgi:rod shape-determining protein MreB
LVGLDLGTNTSALLASTTKSSDIAFREIIPSVVGYAKDGILDGVLPGNAAVLYGQDALKKKLYLDLVKPLKGGTIADLDSARLFARHLRSRLSIEPDTEIRAVIGVPAKADPAAREALRQAFTGVFDKVLFIPEPFLAALGLRDESRLGESGYSDPVRNALFIDIGGGSTDLCLMRGYYPQPEDQVSTTFAGDAIDQLVYNGILQTYPDCQISLHKVCEIKERHSFVESPETQVVIDLVVAGRTRQFDVTEQLGAGCDALLKHILDLSRTLIARADPEAVPELLQNIVLTGGGSLVRGLGVALQTQLISDGYENPKVSVIGPNYKEQVARGALKAARQAKDRQWQTILR